MRVLIQRVKEASVKVDDKIVGKIDKGFLVFLGIRKEDDQKETLRFVNKLINLRCFPDSQGKMNLSLKDIAGEVLVVSQFTLYANCNGGRRPDFLQAAPPEIAEPIYNKFVAEVKESLGSVQTGIFGADMDVALINDGPVTFLLE